jgi:hypothetical protein
MAEPTKQDLQEQLEELQAENARLREALNTANDTKIVSLPIPGSIKLDFETPEGKKVSGKFRFRNGVVRTPLATGEKVPSESLLKIANGKKLTDKEVAQAPILRSVTQEVALERLEYYVAIGSTILEPCK